MATRRPTQMPRLKHALILQSEVESLRVQVEALRVVLADLGLSAEVLLREANPMTPAAEHTAKLVRRAYTVLRTYTADQVRFYYEQLEKDKVLLDFIDTNIDRLERHGEHWALDLRERPNVPTQPLREALAEFKEAMC